MALKCGVVPRRFSCQLYCKPRRLKLVTQKQELLLGDRVCHYSSHDNHSKTTWWVSTIENYLAHEHTWWVLPLLQCDLGSKMADVNGPYFHQVTLLVPAWVFSYLQCIYEMRQGSQPGLTSVCPLFMSITRGLRELVVYTKMPLFLLPVQATKSDKVISGNINRYVLSRNTKLMRPPNLRAGNLQQ